MINYAISMKKVISIFVLTISIFISSNSFALDPKLKIVGTMAGYGVVGGALLGTATMAFGANGRAIAKGASLGLYAGLIFGTYVVTSYELKKRGYGQEQKGDYYPDSQSPYENQNSMNSVPEIEVYNLVSAETKKDPSKDPIFAMNFFNFQF